MSTSTDTQNQPSPAPGNKSWTRIAALAIVPLLLLAFVIGLFWYTDGAGLNIEPVAPVETLQFERTVLQPGRIELHVRNISQDPVEITTVNINDALWPFMVSPSGSIPRLGEATIELDYPWVEAESYAITLFSSNSIAFDTSIGVAAETATATNHTLLSFTLVGIYVGIIPVILGMLWLPLVRNLSPKVMLFLMAATVGLLIFLGVDAISEAIEQAGELGGPFQGIGIVAIGFVGSVLLLDAISRRQMAVKRTETAQRTTLSFLIATGIGLHNLGEGLAIGAAYAIGEATLGTFLVIGFILQNITEGFGIVVPIARDKPSLKTLALLGLIGGGPAIVGAWVGGLLTSRPLSVLFLAIGAGAVFQVAYQIGRALVWKKGTPVAEQMPLTAFAGVVVGMLALFITGVFVN